MKHATVNVDRLHLVILAYSGSALLAQAGPDTFNISENQPVMPAAANKGIEENGLEKGQAESVSREGDAPPGIRRDQI